MREVVLAIARLRPHAYMTWRCRLQDASVERGIQRLPGLRVKAIQPRTRGRAVAVAEIESAFTQPGDFLFALSAQRVGGPAIATRFHVRGIERCRRPRVERRETPAHRRRDPAPHTIAKVWRLAKRRREVAQHRTRVAGDDPQIRARA